MCDVMHEAALYRPGDPHPHAVTLDDVLADLAEVSA